MATVGHTHVHFCAAQLFWQINQIKLNLSFSASFYLFPAYDFNDFFNYETFIIIFAFV